MQRKKTRAEILAQAYLKKRDIQNLLMVGQRTASTIYDKARDLDSRQLGEWQIMPTQVRLKSVLKVTGMDYSLLEKQVKGENK